MGAAIKAELIKFRSVRSSLVLLAFIVVAALLVAVLVGSLVSTTTGSDFDTNDSLSRFEALLFGVQISRLLVGVLAVLVITQEYRFSTIRATLTANPRRMQVYGAKVVTTVILTIAGSVALMAGALGVGGGIFQARGGSLPWGTGAAWRLVGGNVALMIAFGLACLGIGAIIRSSAGSIVVAMVWPIVVEPIAAGLMSVAHRESWQKFLPFNAGGQVVRRDPNGAGAHFGPWTGLAYFSVWAIALAVFGGWLLQRRDA